MKLVLSLSALLVLGVGAGCNLTQDLGGSTGNNVGTGGFSAVGGGPVASGGTSVVVGAGGASMSSAVGGSPSDAGVNMGTGGFGTGAVTTGVGSGAGGFSTGVGGSPAGDAGACRTSGSTCVAWFDCCSESCAIGVCVGSSPMCADGVKDGSETDVDCGGPVCPACAVGKACVTSADCASDVCMAGICH